MMDVVKSKIQYVLTSDIIYNNYNCSLAVEKYCLVLCCKVNECFI